MGGKQAFESNFQILYASLFYAADRGGSFLVFSRRLTGLHHQIVDAPVVETPPLNAVQNRDGEKQVLFTCLKTYRSASGMDMKGPTPECSTLPTTVPDQYTGKGVHQQQDQL